MPHYVAQPLSALLPPRESVLGRLARSLFGATLGAFLAAAIDAHDAASADAPFAALLAIDLGLLAPLAWAVGLAVGVFVYAVDSEQAPSPGDLVRRLEAGAPEARIQRAATCFLAPLAIFVSTVLVAYVARALLAEEAAARTVGARLGVIAFAAAALGVLATVGVGVGITSVLRRGVREGRVGLSPTLALVVGTAIAVGLFALAISSGSVGGEGGVFGIFGVLRREELDLRAPSLLALLAVSAALLPGILRRVFGPLAVAVALVPLVFSLRAATKLDTSPALAAAVERDAPLGKLSLKLVRRMTDRDHDGFSRTFGGGDCNDRNPHVFPTAVDIPGNGVDEDCSGADTPAAQPVARTAPPVMAASPPHPDDWNLVLITIDTLRADLGFTGYNPYGQSISPNLDALAARSTVFEKAYSLASYTGKSVGPMMSGKYPSETHRGWSHFNAYPKEDIMVAERLHAAGVRTLSVQAHVYFDKGSGLNRGFDVVDMSAYPGSSAFSDDDTTTTSDRLTDAAIRVLGKPENTASRFFAWVHYLDPHSQYIRHNEVPDVGRSSRALYDNEIAFTDLHIGRLLSWLAQQPFGPRTAIIITSDHGEAFGEHKMIRHGFELWEELVRVPLIIALPGAPPHRIHERRSAIDNVPTVLDIFHVAPPSGDVPTDFLSGSSLFPEVMSVPATEERRDIFIDMPAGPYNEERRAFIHDGSKLSMSAGTRVQLFDLVADPGETRDLAQSDKAALTAIRMRYDAFRAQLHEVYVRPQAKN